MADRPSQPISPRPVVDDGGDHLPAYISNGCIGVRVPPLPFRPGFAMVNGLGGLHPVQGIEDSPEAPYPVGGDIVVNGVHLLRHQESVQGIEQRYDFACGELTTVFRAHLDGVRVDVEVLTFASRTEPTLVLQEVTARVDRRCDLALVAIVSTDGVPGHCVERHVPVPGSGDLLADGCLRFAPPGGMSECGAALATEILGANGVERDAAAWIGRGDLATSYRFDAEPGTPYVLCTWSALVPSESHGHPDLQAARLAAGGKSIGFDELRRANRAVWDELWQGRLLLHGAGERWQAMADAATFYLHSSVHSSSHASTSIFGLARWHDYHYYYGHVMWDIEAFALPPLLLTQPEAARALLAYRSRSVPAARRHAQMHGRRGVQFPWESAVSGVEAAPLGGLATSAEDHVSAIVAHAFALFSHATGDQRFAREDAWPVVSAVAEWAASRATRTARGVEVHRALGVAERSDPSDNNAFVNMALSCVGRDAVAMAAVLGTEARDEWRELAERMVLPLRDGAIENHEGADPDEEKAETPEALAGLTLFDHPVAPDVHAATLRRQLERAGEYAGSPMLSALLGSWAAELGDRERSAALFEEGYAKFCDERFHNVHEYRHDRFPEQPVAGPFYANLGGFLTACTYRLPRLQLGPCAPPTWCRQGPIVLPAGWDCVEVPRVWAQGRPYRLVAEHGADRARLVALD